MMEDKGIPVAADSPSRLIESYPLYVSGTFSNYYDLNLIRYYSVPPGGYGKPYPAMAVNLTLGMN